MGTEKNELQNMLIISKISIYVAWFQDPEVKIQKEEKWSEEEWKREVSFRVELLNVDAVVEGLNYILLCMRWEYTFNENCSIGLYNWTKLHFIWIKIWFSYYDPTVAFPIIKIVFWIAMIINWN